MVVENADMSLGILVIILIIFSGLQSIMGVGLLLFGTPTLLLMGYNFENVLGILLPTSISISLMQALTGWKLIGIKRDIIIYTLPMVVLGLIAILSLDAVVDVKQIVGAILVMLGLLRINQTLRRFFEDLVNNNSKIYCLIMGTMHGISNMGGSFLTIYVGGRSIKNDVIMANVGFGYLLFGSVQLIILSVYNSEVFGFENITYIIIAATTFLFVKMINMNFISADVYQGIITALIFCYGVFSLFG